MRFWPKIIILATFLFLVSCAGESRPSTPTDTFKAYTAAIKKKDLTTMKLLLSESSRKMHEQEARARGVTLDDVIKTQTLFKEDQTSVKLRNEKIDGDRATLEVQNSYGDWETLPFVKEEGIWKIDKQGFADQIIQDADQKAKELEELFKRQ
jgi:cytochrome oxidase Cu insertion factor (SCO1/SenC/PrrC family)